MTAEPMPDAQVEAALRPYVALAARLLAKAPALREITAFSSYSEYDDQMYTGEEFQVDFAGSHRDEDLDAFPEARRLERRAEAVLEAVPFNREGESELRQETACLTVRRGEAELSIAPTDEYGDERPRRVLIWTLDGDGPVGPARKAAIAPPPPKAPAAHSRAAAARDPGRIRALLGPGCPDWLRDERVPIVGAEAAAGGGWRIFVDPSFDLLDAAGLPSGDEDAQR